MKRTRFTDEQIIGILAEHEAEKAEDEEPGEDEDEEDEDLPEFLKEDDDEEDMRTLLRYPETSSGGIMTTEFAWVPAHFDVEQALYHLRTNEDALEDEFMYYVYLLNPEKQLMGVISLRDLVTAPLDTPLSTWFDDDVVNVSPNDPQEKVAYLIAKYNLMAAPVVDPDTQEMLGIVTVDDAIDIVLPTAWKKKIPRFAGR